jgi:hypothetical protein
VIYIVCPSCLSALRVSPGTDNEAEELLGESCDWYPDKYPCPRCEQPCTLATVVDSDTLRKLDVADVTPMEAFVALSGAGLPEEQDCSATAVGKLFTEKRVKAVATRLIRNSNRCAVDHIEFEDGCKAYFGASSHGAVVYRISRPGKYSDRVVP